MIYTVTFNPSLDYVVHVPRFSEGIVNRTVREQLYPGGKGINVSLMLRNLGVESMALGFVAGSTGESITRFLQEKGFLDMIVERRSMRSVLSHLLKLHGYEKETSAGGV